MKKSVFINDKVVLLKEYESLNQVGNTYEIGGITETAIVLRETKTKIAVGAIRIDDFDEYFEKVENKSLKKFTPWTGLADPNGNLIAVYRTNHKKVQVRLFVKDDGSYIKEEASCNKGDEFNLFFGIQLAIARAVDKFYRKVVLPHNGEQYLAIRKQFKQNKAMMKNMLASLEPKESKEQEITDQEVVED